MILVLLAAVWLVSSTALGFLLGGAIRLADRHEAVEDAP